MFDAERCGSNLRHFVVRHASPFCHWHIECANTAKGQHCNRKCYILTAAGTWPQAFGRQPIFPAHSNLPPKSLFVTDSIEVQHCHKFPHTHSSQANTKYKVRWCQTHSIKYIKTHQSWSGAENWGLYLKLRQLFRTALIQCGIIEVTVHITEYLYHLIYVHHFGQLIYSTLVLQLPNNLVALRPERASRNT